MIFLEPARRILTKSHEWSSVTATRTWSRLGGLGSVKSSACSAASLFGCGLSACIQIYRGPQRNETCHSGAFCCKEAREHSLTSTMLHFPRGDIERGIYSLGRTTEIPEHSGNDRQIFQLRLPFEITTFCRPSLGARIAGLS